MNEQETRSLPIHSLLEEAADDTTGVYPSSVIGGENPYRERNDYQNGWNDAIMSINKKKNAARHWYEDLPANQKYALENLLLDTGGGIVFIHWNEKTKVTMVLLNMNDTFCYACADAEDVKPEDFELLSELYKKFDYDGLIAFVANRNNIEPIKSIITKKYKQAMDFLKIRFVDK